MDTFKKPRDQFIDDVLEGFVRSGKKQREFYPPRPHPYIASQEPLFPPPFLDPGPGHQGLQSRGLDPSGISQPRQAASKTEGGEGPWAHAPCFSPTCLCSCREHGGLRDRGSAWREGQRPAHLMLSSGLVLWTCTSHMGQYLLVSR